MITQSQEKTDDYIDTQGPTGFLAVSSQQPHGSFSPYRILDLNLRNQAINLNKIKNNNVAAFSRVSPC